MKLRWVLIGAVAGALFLAERLRPLRIRRTRAGTVGRNLTIGLLRRNDGRKRDPDHRPGSAVCRAPVSGCCASSRFQVPFDSSSSSSSRLHAVHLALAQSRVPALWRLHAVHHVDIDLDSTTGVRFHFGELALGAGFRAAQIVLLGVDNVTLRVFQQLSVLSMIFQHSNLDLPDAVERRLLPMVVTPRMHGVHHSTRVSETNTNFSSLLSWWDSLHGTLMLYVPQSAITIGVAGFIEPRDVTLERSLALPFQDDARLQADSRHLQRPASAVIP
jgi:hypothetical protein